MLYVAGFWMADRDGTFALWSAHMASDDWLEHRAASAIQLLGQAIAAFGLFQAYVRTTFHQSVRQYGSAHLGIRVHANATAWVGFNLKPRSSVRQQIRDIARFINDRSKDTVFVQEKLIQFEHDIAKLRDEMRELEHKSLSALTSQLHQREAKERKHDAVDLRLAIAGLLIAAFGIALGTFV